MKIAYIGIDLMLPVLKNLVTCGCEILEIFTCKTDNFTEFNTGIIEYAKNNGIPFTDERITVADFDRLREKGCEAVFSAGYYHKIPVYPYIPTVNVHPSYLPYGRGSWPMPYYILNGRKYGGISVHKVADGFDTGDILWRKKFRLDVSDNLESYMQKAMCALSSQLQSLVSNFDCFYADAKPQKGKGTYLKAPTKEMYTVCRTTDTETADRIFRAFYGYECYYTDVTGEYMLIKPRAVHKDLYAEKNGCISLMLSDGFVVCEKEHTNLYDK